MTTKPTQGIFWLNPVDYVVDLPDGPFTEPTGCLVGVIPLRWDFKRGEWVVTNEKGFQEYLLEYAQGAAITPGNLIDLGFNEADHYFGAGEFVHPEMPMFGLTPQQWSDVDNHSGYDLYLLRPKECFILGKRGALKTMGQVKDFYQLMGVEL